MKIEPIGTDCVKITLNKADMKKMGIEYDQLDYNDDKTRTILLELLDTAQLTTGFDGLSAKLFVEIFPGENDGCVFYFTILSKTKTVRPTLHTQHIGRLPDFASKIYPKPVIFSFDNADTVLTAAAQLFSVCSHRIYKSSLYRMDTQYLLLLFPFERLDPAVLSLLSEYGTPCGEGAIRAAFLDEHAILLVKDNALDEIAKYIL